MVLVFGLSLTTPRSLYLHHVHYTDGMLYHLLDFADSVLLPNYDVVDTDLQI